MPAILTKIFLIIITSLSLVGCNFEKTYSREMFLNDFSLKAGFSTNEDFIIFNDLNDLELSEGTKALDYDYLYDILIKVMRVDDQKTLVDLDIIHEIKAGLLDKETANQIIDDALYYLNNQSFETKDDSKIKEAIDISNDEFKHSILISDNDYQIGDIFEYEDVYYVIKEKDGKHYRTSEASLDEIYDKIDLSYSGELDFDNVEVIEEQNLIETKAVYEDELFTRRSDEHFANVKEVNGYRISYSFSRGSLYFYVSKGGDDKVNTFFNTKITNLKPSFKWDYEDGVINEAYFKLDYKTHENFGFSKGKYKRLYGDFNELKGQELIDALSSFVKTQSPAVETSFTICRFKLPIPELPAVSLMVDVKLNFYISGRIGVSLETVNHQGLEILNNKMRIINDNLKDIDGYLQANASSKLSFSIALAMLEHKLMDIGTAFGLKAKLKTTAHLLDDKQTLAISYDIANEVLEDKGIPICADVSFYYVFDIIFNSYDTLASRIGLNKDIHILDEGNQVFNNLRHIENGMFVEKCTRKGFNFEQPELELHPDEIILNTYAIVLKEAEAKIEVLALPENYTSQDLVYELDKLGIVKVNQEGLIQAIRPGVCKLRIYTKDLKYEVFVNILVSNHQLRTNSIC